MWLIHHAIHLRTECNISFTFCSWWVIKIYITITYHKLWWQKSLSLPWLTKSSDRVNFCSSPLHFSEFSSIWKLNKDCYSAKDQQMTVCLILKKRSTYKVAAQKNTRKCCTLYRNQYVCTETIIICDTINRQILRMKLSDLSVVDSTDFIKFREHLYDILICNLDVSDCV